MKRIILASFVLALAAGSASAQTAKKVKKKRPHPPAAPPADFPACLGPAVPMTISDDMPYAQVAFDSGPSGMFVLDFGSNSSLVSLPTLPGLTPIAGYCDPSRLDQNCPIDGFNFGSMKGRVYLKTADFSAIGAIKTPGGPVRQAGMISTDLLNLFVHTLRYGEGLVSQAPQGSFCAPETMRAHGFASLSAEGFFVHDTKTLKPYRTLDEEYVGPWTVSNDPIIPIRIAGVAAIADMDTGYGDFLVRHSININQALFDRIMAANPNALRRWPEKDTTLSTCVPGFREKIEAYTLADGAVEFMADDGTAARREASGAVYVKRTPPEARMTCGGIGAWTTPAAQLGDTFMMDMGTVAFDPFASQIWIPRTASAPAQAAATPDEPDAASVPARKHKSRTLPPSAAPVSAPPADYPACLGYTMPMTISKEMPYATASFGPGLSGTFMIDYQSNYSTINPATIPGLTPIPGSCDPSRRGQNCSFPFFDFGGNWGRVVLRTTEYSALDEGGTVRQSGLIGIDFLGNNVYTLRYSERLVSQAHKGTFCSPETMRAHGFAALAGDGYFENDSKLLYPFSKLDSTYVGPWTVSNGPTVPIRLAGVTSIAELDTGYGDSYVRHSININQALFDQIMASNPGALRRWPEKDTTLSTCVGTKESILAYSLADGQLEFLADDGSVARRYSDAVVWLKRTPREAKDCGGVGTWTAPAAQVGDSFMVDMGEVAFDPYASRVWVPRTADAAAQAPPPLRRKRKKKRVPETPAGQ